jgi:hypothetical protein
MNKMERLVWASAFAQALANGDSRYYAAQKADIAVGEVRDLVNDGGYDGVARKDLKDKS